MLSRRVDIRRPDTKSSLRSRNRNITENIGDIIVIASTETGENSIESPEKGGVFSHYLLKGLGGVADQDKDKFISTIELFNYIKANVYFRDKWAPDALYE